MILVDSSVWIDHLRATEHDLVIALSERRVLQHPMVTLELALGAIPDRNRLITMLRRLPQAPLLDEIALLDYVEEAELPGSGIGLVDAHLLASAACVDGVSLWTRDRRLRQQSDRLGLTASF
jgi:predicted nucleic acid-binding protein